MRFYKCGNDKHRISIDSQDPPKWISSNKFSKKKIAAPKGDRDNTGGEMQKQSAKSRKVWNLRNHPAIYVSRHDWRKEAEPFKQQMNDEIEREIHHKARRPTEEHFKRSESETEVSIRWRDEKIKKAYHWTERKPNFDYESRMTWKNRGPNGDDINPTENILTRGMWNPRMQMPRVRWYQCSGRVKPSLLPSHSRKSRWLALSWYHGLGTPPPSLPPFACRVEKWDRHANDWENISKTPKLSHNGFWF